MEKVGPVNGCYSYAGPYRGLKFPGFEEFESPRRGSCEVALCDGNCDHNVLTWDGNGYVASRAWISAEDSAVIDLEDAR